MARAHRLRGHVAGLRDERRVGRGSAREVGGHVAGQARLGDVGLGELDGGHDVVGVGRQARRPRSRRRRGPGRARPRGRSAWAAWPGPRASGHVGDAGAASTAAAFAPARGRAGRGRDRDGVRTGRTDRAGIGVDLRGRRRGEERLIEPGLSPFHTGRPASRSRWRGRRSRRRAGGGTGVGRGGRSSDGSCARCGRSDQGRGCRGAPPASDGAPRTASVRRGQVREGRGERLVVRVHAVAGRDHEVGEQGELGVDDVVSQLRGR